MHFASRVRIKRCALWFVQVKEAAAAALARMQQDKARAEPGVPSLEERASSGIPRRPGAAAHPPQCAYQNFLSLQEF